MKNHLRQWLIGWRLRRCVLVSGELPQFWGRPWPKFAGEGQIRLGPECAFRSYRTPSAITALKGAVVEVGRGCLINDGVNICAAKAITIGDYSGLGDGATILDTAFHPVDQDEETVCAPIRIGRNVWIGQGVTIMPGAIIGDHSVIGANSMVAGEIPPRAVALGAPARPFKSIKCADNWVRLRAE